MENEKTGHPSRSETGRYLREEKIRKANGQGRGKQRPLVWIAAAAGILLLAVIALYVCFCTDQLVGTWRYDEVTAYQFDGKGNGKLILPDKEYPFSYEIAEEKLSIDFESEGVRDFIYDYSVKENQLTLAGGEGEDTITYVLTK